MEDECLFWSEPCRRPVQLDIGDFLFWISGLELAELIPHGPVAYRKVPQCLCVSLGRVSLVPCGSKELCRPDGGQILFGMLYCNYLGILLLTLSGSWRSIDCAGFLSRRWYVLHTRGTASTVRTLSTHLVGPYS